MKSILIVDDDRFILASLERNLHHVKEWQVDTCSDAQTAIDQVKSKSYHLILSDYQMPGTDGLSLMRTLKALQPDAIGIILSGDNAGELKALDSSHMVQRFMQKPVDRTILINVLTDLLA